MKYAVGSLVRAENREWIVQPESTANVLFLRPCIGTDIEPAIVLPDLVNVTPALIGLPDPECVSSDLYCAIYLLESARKGVRSPNGLFLSIAGIAKRCGVITTDQVKENTVILLVRSRYQIEPGDEGFLTDDVFVTGFSGNVEFPTWLSNEDSEKLLEAKPSANVAFDRSVIRVRQVINKVDLYLPELSTQANIRARSSLETICGERADISGSQNTDEITIRGAPDIFGIFILTPCQM